MYNPKISVIVPVYKAEGFLSRCVESILGQSYHNIELLLIDDGSPDNSGIICDDYASIDNRVRVFHKKNGGVSSARNCGLDNASGDLIFFCDSDDWIDEDTFEVCIHSKANDIVQIPRDGGSNLKYYEEDIYCTKKRHLIHFICDNFTYEIWGKLYKKEVIGDVRFPLEISVGEDVIFLLAVYCNVSSYYISSSVGMYHYNDANSDSIMTTLLQKEKNDELMIKKLLVLKQVHWTLAYFFISTYYWRLCLKRDDLLINFWKSFPLFGISYHSLSLKSMIKILLLCICGGYKSVVK